MSSFRSSINGDHLKTGDDGERRIKRHSQDQTASEALALPLALRSCSCVRDLQAHRQGIHTKPTELGYMFRFKDVP